MTYVIYVTPVTTQNNSQSQQYPDAAHDGMMTNYLPSALLPNSNWNSSIGYDTLAIENLPCCDSQHAHKYREPHHASVCVYYIVYNHHLLRYATYLSQVSLFWGHVGMCSEHHHHNAPCRNSLWLKNKHA